MTVVVESSGAGGGSHALEGVDGQQDLFVPRLGTVLDRVGNTSRGATIRALKNLNLNFFVIAHFLSRFRNTVMLYEHPI